MKRLPDNECRRCGHSHDDTLQLVDPNNRWAICSVQCACGHYWTMIHTAPGNLSALRAWIGRGCTPEEGPLAGNGGGPWHPYRLEGVSPTLISAAS